jgi:hypothetical protein
VKRIVIGIYPHHRLYYYIKKVSVVMVLLSMSALTRAQFEYYKPGSGILHSSRDLIISASPDVLFNTPNGIQFAGGLKIQMFVSKRISFDADLVISHNYVHAGWGLLGIPIWLLFGSSLDKSADYTLQDFVALIVSCALCAEHTSCHIPLHDISAEISPYVSLLRYRYAYEHGNYSDPGFIGEQLCGAAGLEFSKYLKRFVLSPYVECNIGYKNKIPGICTGVCFGMSFPSRKSE